MDYNALMNELMPSIISMAVTVLTVLGGYLGMKLKEILNTKQKRDIVEATVKYVEQVGKSLGSEEKLELAKKKALEWLNSKGLTVSEVELEILIEAFVNDFFGHYNEIEEVEKPELTL